MFVKINLNDIKLKACNGNTQHAFEVAVALAFRFACYFSLLCQMQTHVKNVRVYNLFLLFSCPRLLKQ